MKAMKLLERGYERLTKNNISHGPGNRVESFCMLSSLWDRDQSYSEGASDSQEYSKAVRYLRRGILCEAGETTDMPPAVDQHLCVGGRTRDEEAVYRFNDANARGNTHRGEYTASLTERKKILDAFNRGIQIARQEENKDANS